MDTRHIETTESTDKNKTTPDPTTTTSNDNSPQEEATTKETPSPTSSENSQNNPPPSQEEQKDKNSETNNLEQKFLKLAPLRDRVIEELMMIYDPEIPVSIYELGLVYEVTVEKEKYVKVVMTLTSPACPVAGSLPGEVEARIKRLEGVEKVDVELVWDPPWNASMMSEAAQLALGMF